MLCALQPFCFSQVKGLFINLTPLIPLSTLGEGEEKKEGLRPSRTPYNIFGASPLLNSLYFIPFLKGWRVGKDIKGSGGGFAFL